MDRNFAFISFSVHYFKTRNRSTVFFETRSTSQSKCRLMIQAKNDYFFYFNTKKLIESISNLFNKLHNDSAGLLIKCCLSMILQTTFGSILFPPAFFYMVTCYIRAHNLISELISIFFQCNF